VFTLKPDVGLCQRITDLPKDPHTYWMEPKLDGTRIVATAKGGHVDFRTRAGLDNNAALPHIAKALTGLDVVLDGEVVWFDPRTDEVDFHHGSGLLRTQGAESARRQAHEGWLTYMVFDFLELGGYDLRAEPIEKRRALLAELVTGLNCPHIRLVEQGEATVENWASYVRRYREGVVLKRKGSHYPHGRTPAWLKLKVVDDADVVVTGFVQGQGKYADTLGAIRFGQYKDGALTERGTCSGMTDADRDAIWQHQADYLGRVLVIHHMGVLPGQTGFRHPQWSHLRSDKSPEDCLWD
jgi:bifunctional non-homologous end joining protein LigD